MEELAVTEAGYVYVYLSNESETTVEVYYDDFSVTLTEGPVVQINEYYPFGLTAYTWTREDEAFTNYLFQNKEYDSLTQWHDFHARQYDAALGRWLASDPAGQFSSPYVGMGNMPMMGVDPDGELAWFVPIIIGAVIGGTSQGIAASNKGEAFFSFGGFWQGAFIGAIAASTGVGVTAWISGTAFTAGVGASTGFWAIVAGGAASGAVSGGLTSGVSGGSIAGGGWRGAATGALSAGLGTVGGSVGSFGGQVGLGIASGATAGALSATLYKENITRGAIIGGAFGGTFAAISSPQLRNAIRGQGFRSNNKVLAGFVARGDYQGALDYFGFSGTYNPHKPAGGGYVEGNSYFGSTNPETGAISYGDLAFDSYDVLKSVAVKESFHSTRVLNGIPLATQDDSIISGSKYFPEEALGFENGYRNRGFYPRSTVKYVTNIENYRSQSMDNSLTFFTKHWWHFLYGVPRRY